jgi:hypothetical protein
MASTTISLVYNDIFEKEPQGMFDDGYECSIASDGMMTVTSSVFAKETSIKKTNSTHEPFFTIYLLMISQSFLILGATPPNIVDIFARRSLIYCLS